MAAALHFFFLQAGQFWTVAKQYQLIIIFFDLDYASPTMYGGWENVSLLRDSKSRAARDHLQAAE